MKLSKIGEFGLIRRIERLCRRNPEGLISGIGDDAAVIKGIQGFTLITSDMLIEGVHFDLKYTTFYQLGYKTLAVNMSDIFAMGGKPRFFLINIGIPKGFDSGDVEKIYRGMAELTDRHDITIIGGDTTSTARGGLLLSGTLIGETKRAITRSGAMPGDGIFVTGTLGDSAMGLELLRMEKKIHLPVKPQTSYLIKRHLTPEPYPLKRTNDVTSMIDISDGLLIDLSHICDESGVGAVIYKDKIPLSDELVSVAKAMNKDPFRFALAGGEDYVLLFTASSRTKKGATKIGEVIKKGRFIIDEKGRKTHFKAEGYEHFR